MYAFVVAHPEVVTVVTMLADVVLLWVIGRVWGRHERRNPKNSRRPDSASKRPRKRSRTKLGLDHEGHSRRYWRAVRYRVCLS